MNKLRGWLIAGVCLLVGGLILGIAPIQEYWWTKRVPQVAVSPFTATASAAAEPAAYIEGEPVRIQIPSLGIDLPVVKGYYNAKTGQWTLYNDKVQYAVMTKLANNKEGNTFLYGHNRVGVFKELNHIKLGEKVIVTTANNHTFTYSFTGALETAPTDTSLFNYQGKPILTVQTCSGVWYQNRQLFTFVLEQAV